LFDENDEFTNGLSVLVSSEAIDQMFCRSSYRIAQAFWAPKDDGEKQPKVMQETHERTEIVHKPLESWK